MNIFNNSKLESFQDPVTCYMDTCEKFHADNQEGISGHELKPSQEGISGHELKPGQEGISGHEIKPGQEGITGLEIKPCQEIFLNFIMDG